MKQNRPDFLPASCRETKQSPIIMLFLLMITIVADVSGCTESTRAAGTTQPPDTIQRTDTTSAPGSGTVIVVDTLTRFQTMSGWEATSQAGQELPGFAQWASPLMDAVVNVGINRVRLEVRPGWENPNDFFVPDRTGPYDMKLRCARLATVNDNADPNVINPSGFHFGELDESMTKVVLPMRDRLAARGEKLFLNLNYVAFLRQCQPAVYVHADPAEYAEFILAAFSHLRSTYGVVPDAVEIILEPDNAGPPWNGYMIGRSIVATAARLSAAGFNPAFIAPSSMSLGNAILYATEMFTIPGVRPHLRELSYHRYGITSPEALASLANLAASNGAGTAMLEHIGSDAENLYTDITVGQVSAWQQYTLGYNGADNGGKYFAVGTGQPVMGERTRYLRQYFKYVRMGARRVKAESREASIRPVAFQNTNGGLVVVMHVANPQQIQLQGLSAGTYGASATTKAATGAELGDRTIVKGQSLSLNVSAPGIVTVYRK